MRNKTTKRLIEPVIAKSRQKKYQRFDKDGNEIASKYYVEQLPYKLPCVKPDRLRPNPTMGISNISFSYDYNYLYSRSERYPRVLWIWNTNNYKLASILVHASSIRQVKWNEKDGTLSIACGNGKLYQWSPEGVSIVDIPSPKFTAIGLQWNSNGNRLLLNGAGNKFCICYIDEVEEIISDEQEEVNHQIEVLDDDDDQQLIQNENIQLKENIKEDEQEFLSIEKSLLNNDNNVNIQKPLANISINT